MNKHTPGPWKTTHSAMSGYRVSDSTGWGVAVVLKDANDEANAHLIAAAPQMLEALEACAAYWYYKRSPSIPEQSELISLGAEQAQRLIKAAIVAAKGKYDTIHL